MPGQETDHELERLKLLFDYTKFHIALYATLITLIIALLSLGADEVQYVQKWLLFGTSFLFALAGACGGIVASNIPNHAKVTEFLNAEIGPRVFWSDRTKKQGYSMCLLAEARVWATREHAFFWSGIGLAVAMLFWGLICPAEPKNSFCPTSLECRPV